MVAVGPNVVVPSTRERLEQWGLSRYPSPALPRSSVISAWSGRRRNLLGCFAVARRARIQCTGTASEDKLSNSGAAIGAMAGGPCQLC